ncbi:MAG: hypothetical protein RL660_2295 [Bacteroidota bacterium]|jgi:DNA-binding LytR/AlgR family response regulator
MNSIIIDDEPLARQGLEMQLKNFTEVNLIQSFSNALDAVPLIQQGNIDLIFLDINMPEINGLDFAKKLTNSPLIIFATAYPQYALDSYELDAIDYLLKPIRIERLTKAINKACSHLELLSNNKEEHKIESVDDETVFIKADRKYIKVSLKDILFIEGLKDYVVIYTKEKKIITAMNLKAIYSNLPTKLFSRISKSHIVNLQQITVIDTYSIFIGEHELPLSANHKEEFMQMHIYKRTLKK